MNSNLFLLCHPFQQYETFTLKISDRVIDIKYRCVESQKTHCSIVKSYDYSGARKNNCDVLVREGQDGNGAHLKTESSRLSFQVSALVP